MHFNLPSNNNLLSIEPLYNFNIIMKLASTPPQDVGLGLKASAAHHQTYHG